MSNGKISLMDSFKDDASMTPSNLKKNKEGGNIPLDKKEKKVDNKPVKAEPKKVKATRQKKGSNTNKDTSNSLDLSTMNVSKRAKNIIKIVAAKNGLTIRSFLEAYAEECYINNKDYVDDEVQRIVSSMKNII